MNNQNIVLIGMPGCGKTTVGKELSERLKIPFCDIDEYIVTSEGKSIPEIFEKGEEYFRELETKAVSKVSDIFPQVISTGGGVIKKPSNIETLKKTGVIFFINRPIEDIANDVDIKTRPLLKAGTAKLYELYKERYSLYKKYCDYQIENQSLEECVNKIISIFK
ncbi:shikimate kinase [Clostridium homopropionicum DSM 5847]|uniref:Shikimate kinase n=2 Tax=Clostridium TaxID=1485 RepID=A0A0L6Z7C6_9CLOT|nr:shikimate kinase [Clostridium homopropionicum DSM 5847]SFG46055.1 shikimate kinase [Clostridium homopropionicum]